MDHRLLGRKRRSINLLADVLWITAELSIVVQLRWDSGIEGHIITTPSVRDTDLKIKHINPMAQYRYNSGGLPIMPGGLARGDMVWNEKKRMWLFVNLRHYNGNQMEWLWCE